MLVLYRTRCLLTQHWERMRLPHLKKSDGNDDQLPPPRTVWDDITVAAVPTVIAITIQKLLDEFFDWLKKPEEEPEDQHADDDDDLDDDDEDDEFDEEEEE